MRVYLDTNVFGRFFDDKSQLRIALESEACLIVLELIEQKRLDGLSSDILRLEISRSSIMRRIYMQSLIKICSKHVSETGKLKEIAKQIAEESGVEGRDALHIASACVGEAEYFITCDNDITKKHRKIEKITKKLGYKIKMINPLYFIEEVKL